MSFGLPIGFIGPKDRWQAELAKVSRSGLRYLVERYAFVYAIDPANLLEQAKRAKEMGRLDDAHFAHLRFMADPRKAIDESIRRQRAAKKAARRRKRASK